MPPDEVPITFGIDEDILNRFLKLFRDQYPAADIANNFLETKTGFSGINIAITNQRDAISHLVTLLKSGDTLTHEEQIGQYAGAEEHLRRAIIESYSKTRSIIGGRVDKIYATYKKEVLTLLPHQSLSSAPNLVSINATLREIGDHSTKGRKAKARNIWDKEWEDGIKHFTIGCEKLEKLEETLEKYVFRAQQIREVRRNKLLALYGILTTIVFGIIGVVALV